MLEKKINIFYKLEWGPETFSSTKEKNETKKTTYKYKKIEHKIDPENQNADNILNSLEKAANKEESLNQLKSLTLEKIKKWWNIFEAKYINYFRQNPDVVLDFLKKNPKILNLIIEHSNTDILWISSCQTRIPQNLDEKQKKIFWNFETILKDQYKQNQINKVKKILDNYLTPDWKKINIDSLFKSEQCNPVKLTEKLKNLHLKDKDGNKLTEEQIDKILSGIAKVKKLDAKDVIENWNDENKIKFFYKKLEKYNSLLPIEIEKKKSEILNTAKNIWLNIKNENIFWKACKKYIVSNNILKSIYVWIDTYNSLDNTYYLNNPKDIIKITNSKKFLSVVKILKKNHKKIDLFFNMANPSIRWDFNTIKEFYNITKEKISIYDIKEINFSKLKKKEQIELLKMLNENSLNFMLIKYKKIIEQLWNTNYTNKLNKLLNYSECSNKEDLDDEENNFKLDNSLLKLLKDNYKKWVESIVWGNFSIWINKLNELPKTLNYILSNDNIITKIIEKDENFYKFLTKTQQKEFSIIYAKSILNKKNLTLDEKWNLLALLQFKDISNIINIFSLMENNTKLIQNIIKRPLFKATMIKFIKENKNEISKLNKKQQQKINEILKQIDIYNKTINKFKKVYNNSEFKKTIENNKNNNLINKLYNNKKFIEYIEKTNSNLQWPIVWICRLTLWDWWKWETIDWYISMLAENIEWNTKKEKVKKFQNILNDINKFVNETFLKQQQEEENIKLDKKDIQILKSINPNYLKENWKNINYKWIDDDFSIFLKYKKEQLKKEKKNIEDLNFDVTIKEFIKIKWLDWLSQEWQNRIFSHIKTKKNVYLVNKLAEQTNKNPNYVYNIYKSWDKEKIKKFHESLDNEYFSYQIEYGSIIEKSKYTQKNNNPKYQNIEINNTSSNNIENNLDEIKNIEYKREWWLVKIDNPFAEEEIEPKIIEAKNIKEWNELLLLSYLKKLGIIKADEIKFSTDSQKIQNQFGIDITKTLSKEDIIKFSKRLSANIFFKLENTNISSIHKKFIKDFKNKFEQNPDNLENQQKLFTFLNDNIDILTKIWLYDFTEQKLNFENVDTNNNEKYRKYLEKLHIESI